ncbi:MAG: C25 family cysteine peptidase [Candidatus Cloacimonetes bacterium]|nr:C25 family cysteine peptidase [Candidatus Cloacimonadota bacterium]MDD2682974.1 C25 family cysteine peptidase [Candidatus Cloacimonadota bacterium]
MRKLIVALTLMLIFTALIAVEIKLDVAPFMQAKNSLQYPKMIKAAEPMLPYYPVRVLLPFGETMDSASISITDNYVAAQGIDIEHANVQQPISLSQTAEITGANPEIYLRDAFYPAKDWDYLGTQYYRGYAIAVFNVYPFKYNSVKREVLAGRSIEIEIASTFTEQEAITQAKFVTPNARTFEDLNRLVANPEQSSSYAAFSSYKQHQVNRNIDLSSPRTMIVITNSTAAPWFDEYITFRNNQGINTGIYLVDDIYDAYEGEDNAEKVRNFIIDAYSTWNTTPTPLEYVIMGGDDELVPLRGVFGRVGSTRDNNMPSDLYFSNLDGDWNANNNAVYGEMSDLVDYIPELHIGRFPAESNLEFQNIFRKTQYYVTYNTFSNNKAVFFGENLNNNPMTWGGDYKDEVHQYLPDSYYYSTQYQRNGTYSPEIVWDTINHGVNVMNHMGHSNETFLLGQGNGSIHRLTNTEYGFLFSQGCYPAAFDQATSGAGECIGEHLLFEPGGLFAFLGNTRYGWYSPGSTDGASQYYDRDYFRGLFEEGHPELGRALTFSRLENMNTAMTDDVMRWCYMEMILFGDPSIGIKLPDPDLPMLALQSYHFDDSQGDGDGNINPGELLRLYPVISNTEGWATAMNVSIRLEAVPYGVAPMGDCLMVSSIAPGGTSPEDIFISLQLPETMDYGTFSVRLAVESFHPVTNLSTGVQYYDCSFEITMFDNRFPWETENAGKSAPIVADFSGDGILDIMYLDVFGGVHLIGPDGEEFEFFNHQDQQNINRSNAMGEIDNLEGADFAFSSRSGYLYALTASGEEIFSYDAQSPFLFSPVISDINNDGQNEVIAGALDGKVHAIQADGTNLPGFPVQLSSSFQSELAVGDLDQDGSKEIICGMSLGALYVVGSDGSILEAFNHTLDFSLTGAPVILDNGHFAIASASVLYLFDNLGNQVFSLPIDSPVAGGLITADIDRNSSLDIVFVSTAGKLWVVTQGGYSLYGFPVDTGMNFSCPPLVADVDNDEQYEIVLHSYINSIFVYETNGDLMDGYPFGTTYNGATPGSLVDFDDSGFFKLIAGFSNGVLMSNLRFPVSDLAPWTVYRGSLSRESSFASTGYVANADPTQNPLPLQLLQNYPNPFNPNTNIAFNLTRDGFVKLNIFNTKGQKVRSLHQGQLGKGSHTLAWDGCDENGRGLASGIYFYRLESNGQAQTRKMLLMK